jgi:nitrogen fixation-related uncharacterized protein
VVFVGRELAMEVVILLLFVGAVLVAGAIGFFLWSVATDHHEHADRLAVLPLDDNWKDPLTASAESKS